MIPSLVDGGQHFLKDVVTAGTFGTVAFYENTRISSSLVLCTANANVSSERENR